MVSRDHGIFGWAVAFFKESMRRDTMAGMRTAFAEVEVNSHHDLFPNQAYFTFETIGTRYLFSEKESRTSSPRVTK